MSNINNFDEIFDLYKTLEKTLGQGKVQKIEKVSLVEDFFEELKKFLQRIFFEKNSDKDSMKEIFSFLKENALKGLMYEKPINLNIIQKPKFKILKEKLLCFAEKKLNSKTSLSIAKVEVIFLIGDFILGEVSEHNLKEVIHGSN